MLQVVTDTLSVALGQITDNVDPLLWKSLLAQPKATTIQAFLLFILLSFATSFVAYKGEKASRREDARGTASYERPTTEELVYLICLVAAVALTLLFFILTINSIPNFLNPEYWAVKELINLRKS